MIIIRNRFTSFLLGENYVAMCLYPFLLVDQNFDIMGFPVSLNHERIHARQQIEMLGLFFYLWYGVEYIVRLIRYRSHREAYLNLSHEREAFSHEADPAYLSVRRLFSWLKYL